MDGLTYIEKLAAMALKAYGNQAVPYIDSLISMAKEKNDSGAEKRLIAVLKNANKLGYSSAEIFEQAANSNLLSTSKSALSRNIEEYKYLEPPLAPPTERPLLYPQNLNSIRDYIDLYKTGVIENIMFIGPSGTGKTMTASWLANEIGLPLYRLSFSKIFDSFLGKTARNLAGALKEVEENSGILFLDEMDALLKSREMRNDHAEMQRTVNMLLMELDNFSLKFPVFAATNLYEQVDKAVSRRFHRILFFDIPNDFLMERYIRTKLNYELPPYLIPVLVNLCKGFSYAHLEIIIKKIDSANKTKIEWFKTIQLLRGVVSFEKDNLISDFINSSIEQQAKKLVEWGLDKQCAAGIFNVSESLISKWLTEK